MGEKRVLLMSERWVLVPEKSTEVQSAAGWIDKEDVIPAEIYTAMLAARPPVPPEWLAAAVERAAMALADCRLWPGAWSQANEVERGTWLFEARAAIIAALEMTDE